MRALTVSELCPDCGGRLRVRTRRDDGSRFLGCARYPACRWTEDLDERVMRLVERILELEAELADVRVVAAPVTTVLSRELRALIVLAHPDRWPRNKLALQITQELTRLRDQITRAA